jgi:hypothetical protein
MALKDTSGHMMALQRQPLVAYEQDDHPALARNLERELKQAHDEQVLGLTAAKDWPDFQKRRGTIDGLNIALSLCQATRKKLEA